MRLFWIHFWGAVKTFVAPGYTFGRGASLPVSHSRGLARLLGTWIHFGGEGKTFGVPGYTFEGRARLLVRLDTLLAGGRVF